jgi:hypothetical protein
LALQRYKAFDALTTIEIRPLTVLVGANNAGKSALARALPLFAGGLLPDLPSSSSGPLPLVSFGLQHGETFEDLITGRSGHGSIELSTSFRSGSSSLSLSSTVQNVVSPGRPTREVVLRWTLSGDDGQSIAFERVGLESDMYDVRASTPDGPGIWNLEVSFVGLLPMFRLASAGPALDWLTRSTSKLIDWAKGLRYLRSPRDLQPSRFRTPERAPGSVGIAGHEAPLMLATSPELLRPVRDWFEKAFGVRLNVRQHLDTSVVEVSAAPGRNWISIDQAGQGLSQVLPVAIQLLTAKDAGPGVDIIEHPEGELHPHVHAEVADLIVEHLSGTTRPLVVETHSEVLLLRLRRKVAEGALSAKDLAIYWIDRDEDLGSALVRRIEITAGGEVLNWPDGVFQESYEEVMAIRRAARTRGAP